MTALILCALTVVGSAEYAVADNVAFGVALVKQGKYKQAMPIFKRLAARGNPFAQFNLGVLYLRGKGVKRNLVAAARWFKMSAAKGYIPAMTNLGSLYAAGRGVKKSDRKAVTWFRRAALKNDPLAQSKLGVMYANGEGVPRNDVKAYMLFHVSAAGGFARAAALRDEVALRMKPAQIARAKLLAGRWIEKRKARREGIKKWLLKKPAK